MAASSQLATFNLQFAICNSVSSVPSDTPIAHAPAERRVSDILPNAAKVVVPIVAGIGNALMAVPMVRALKRARPGARITVLARIDAMAEVFRRLEEVEETIVTGTGAPGVLRMIAEARRRHADAYLVPFPSNRWQYAMLAASSGARWRVLHGYAVGHGRAMHCVGTRVPAVRGSHDGEQNLRLLTALGIESPAIEGPVFPLREDERAAAAEMVAGIGVRGPFIAIHAGSARTILAAAKRWPTARYAELVRALQREFAGEVVLLEGPDEAGVADEIVHAGGAAPVLRLAGPLGESAAVLARAALYVGSDSGLAHLSAAVGTRAVTLFAPAEPDRVCPWGNRDLVVQAPAPCAPCFLYPWHATKPKMRCRVPLCIERITIDAVLTAIRRAQKGDRSPFPGLPSPGYDKTGDSDKNGDKNGDRANFRGIEA